MIIIVISIIHYSYIYIYIYMHTYSFALLVDNFALGRFIQLVGEFLGQQISGAQLLRPFVILRIVRPRICESKFRENVALVN